MHPHLVQKPGDEVQHAALIVGETIVDEPEGAPGALSILCSIQVGFRAEHLLQSVRYGAFDYSGRWGDHLRMVGSLHHQN